MPWQSQEVFRGRARLTSDAIAASQRDLCAWWHGEAVCWPIGWCCPQGQAAELASSTCIVAELTCCHTVMELWPCRHISCSTPSKRNLQEPSTAVRFLQDVHPHLNSAGNQ